MKYSEPSGPQAGCITDSSNPPATCTVTYYDPSPGMPPAQPGMQWGTRALCALGTSTKWSAGGRCVGGR